MLKIRFKKKILSLLPFGALLFSLSFASCTTNTNNTKEVALKDTNIILDRINGRLANIVENTKEIKELVQKGNEIEQGSLEILKNIEKSLKNQEKEKE